MASNPYFVNYYANNEQTLVEDLVVESLRMYSHDVIYIPRNGVNRDHIFNEFEYSTFSNTYNIEVYVKNVQSFGGDGQFLGRFSLEVRDQITLTMAVRSFNEFIAPSTQTVRPLEGDVIFVPFLAAAYEIRFVENAGIFFQMGQVQCWDITVEVFEYSNEIFATGIPAIDDLYNGDNFANTANLETVESYAENAAIQLEANTIFDWDDADPWTEGNL